MPRTSTRSSGRGDTSSRWNYGTWCASIWRSCTGSSTWPSAACDRNVTWSRRSSPEPDWSCELQFLLQRSVIGLNGRTPDPRKPFRFLRHALAGVVGGLISMTASIYLATELAFDTEWNGPFVRQLLYGLAVANM